ncbi:AsmA family protein [Sphingomonas colocasiae]|uniref:AsmA family protein n=1 Tax=Sphingomonas colocasiae TaxID=1848973 RepID=A0ABS7PYJ9_9SPHN|nr:AsmA-like C-terminal region-containing protein [Sphingomonas colocasiae]MBY8823314.1 AsmA family protein [Sphingomonas colocasiae]MBY8826449.1 AsmA family protein [Sphingomonas colocasiae]
MRAPPFSAYARPLAIVAGLLVLAILVVAAFPVGLLRATAERRLSSHFGAPVTLGALSRREAISFTPEIVVRDVRIGQPAWAGKGDFLRVSEARARMPILSLVTGRAMPRALHVKGLAIALVRDATGRSNWSPQARAGETRDDGGATGLETLVIENGRFSLRDAKRRLELAGTLSADPRTGLAASAAGRFDGAPARLEATGGGTAVAPGKAWPFHARLTSTPFALDARGTMAGVLDTGDMRMTMRAQGDSLKRLDQVIEAGLFGTQRIDLRAEVRRTGRDWSIDRLEGVIGRSRLQASATILKRDGRTRIDARIRAVQLDFDDLADDAGLAAARAKEARIGKRVIPDTRINLSRMGPTDGVIRFSIDRLLVKGGSVFRSLRGELRLDRRVLTVENAVAGLATGQLKGRVRVDSTGTVPVFSSELTLEGTTLGTLIGQPDKIEGPLRGIVRITGRGDTIRQAFASGDGKIAFVASGGAMNRTAAYVLGQDLGGAIGQSLSDRDAMVPLRCAILAFDARKGVLHPAPLVVETDISRGTGRGEIKLDGETLQLAVNGASREKAALALVDPVRVKGTLSSPEISVAPARAGGGEAGVLGTIGRSIGSALGLRRNPNRTTPPPAASGPDCARLASAALR